MAMLRLCVDNGVMVAWNGMQRLKLGLAEKPMRAAANEEMIGFSVEVRPRWPIGQRDGRSTTQQQQLAKRKRNPGITTASMPTMPPPPDAPPAGENDAKRSK